ncbi:hypothetical protein ACFRKB_09020 [Streptomyces scopuliridis]|uniref:hypothetical protein n=1 Tax=Streptomyces scopuliridis TaxID=452529 RepID=UPI0036BB2C48
MASPSCDAPHGRPLRRVVVLGSPGSGKTAFCHLLAVTTALPLYHLDDLYWSPGWSRPGEEEWAHRVRALCDLPRWIADGNYADSTEPRVRAADLVVLLDRHPLLCAVALVRRSLRLRRSARAPEGVRGTPPDGGRGRRRPREARGPEYVPRGLRESGDPPVLSVTALLRKALFFRRRDLVVIHGVLGRTGTPVRRCRTRRQAAALLADLGGPGPCPSAAPGETRGAGSVDGGLLLGPEPRDRQQATPQSARPQPAAPQRGGPSPTLTISPCTCPASAPATSLWRST